MKRPFLIILAIIIFVVMLNMIGGFAVHSTGLPELGSAQFGYALNITVGLVIIVTVIAFAIFVMSFRKK